MNSICDAGFIKIGSVGHEGFGCLKLSVHRALVQVPQACKP